MRRAQPGGQLGLGPEPGLELRIGGQGGPKCLQRNRPLTHRVERPVHLTHAASTDQLIEAIRPEVLLQPATLPPTGDRSPQDRPGGARGVDAPVGIWLEIGYRRAGWAAHTAVDDALLDLGPHLVDLARWLTRAEVSAVRRASVRAERAEFDLLLGPARARIRCATDRPHHELIDVRHRDGSRIGRYRQGGLLAAVRGRLRPSTGPHPLATSLTAQLEAFARAVRGSAGPTLGRAADGVAVMAVLAAVRASAAGGGQPVPVETAGSPAEAQRAG